MRWLVVLFVAASCGGATVPSPSVSPTPVATAALAFDPRAFTVGVYYDDEQRGEAVALKSELAQAWSTATGGRSALTFDVSDHPDVYLFLGNEPAAKLPEGTQNAWYLRVPPLRFVYIHRGTTRPTIEAVHEIGHVLGAPHWQDCPTPPIEVMCFIQGSATTFSDRELRAMGL